MYASTALAATETGCDAFPTHAAWEHSLPPLDADLEWDSIEPDPGADWPIPWTLDEASAAEDAPSQGDPLLGLLYGLDAQEFAAVCRSADLAFARLERESTPVLISLSFALQAELARRLG